MGHGTYGKDGTYGKGITNINNTFNRFKFLVPVILVLLLAGALVYVKTAPDIETIARETETYRKDVGGKAGIEAIPVAVITEQPEIALVPPEKDKEIIVPTSTGENKTINTSSESAYTKSGILSALVLIGIAVPAGFGIYLLFKYKKRLSIKMLFGTALAAIGITTIFFFGFMTFIYFQHKGLFTFSEDHQIFILAPLSFPLGILIAYTIVSRKTSKSSKNVALLIGGALMGAFLASLIPIYFILPLVAGISLYDIYSVKMGPIRKIIELSGPVPESERRLPDTLPNGHGHPIEKPVPVQRAVEEPVEKSIEVPKAALERYPQPPDDEIELIMLYETPEWDLGLGDLVFYPMLASAALMYFMLHLPYYGFYTTAIGIIVPWLVFILMSAAVLSGFAVTIKLLAKKGLLPGLPISIAFGLITFFCALGVMELINLALYQKFVPLF